MIKVDINKKQLEYEGKKVDLLTELTWLFRNLMKEEHFEKEDIEYCVNLAQEPIEDVAKRCFERMPEIMAAALLGDKEAMKILEAASNLADTLSEGMNNGND